MLIKRCMCETSNSPPAVVNFSQKVTDTDFRFIMPLYKSKKLDTCNTKQEEIGYCAYGITAQSKIAGWFKSKASSSAGATCIHDLKHPT